MGRLDRAIALTAASIVAVLGFLPLANWISGGHRTDWYGAMIQEWLTGSSIVAGVAVVGVILARRSADRPLPARFARLLQGVERKPFLSAVALGVVAGLVYAAAGTFVLGGRPLLIDEIVQVFQARIFAAGSLWLGVSPHSEFFSSMHVIDTGGRVYGQFPAGGPGMLVPAVLLGVERLAGPAFGAASVVLFFLLLRHVEPRPGVRLGATLLFALAPFALFMSGSYMNHVTVLTCLLLGMLGLARVTAGGQRRIRDGLLLGLGFGIAATIRPVDALAFALPAGCWLLAHSVRHRTFGALAGAAFGIALPVGVLLWINAQTTGSALTFGYTVMWGSGHDLGFHSTPWGDVHTPVRGLELLNLYFLRLQVYLFELPIPSLLPGLVALGFTRRFSPFDRFMLVSAGLLAGLYFAYWHDGFYLGPRFMYPLLPILVWWTARCLPVLRERFGDRVYRGARYAAVAAVLIAVATSIPIRAREYRNGMLTQRWDADGAAEAAGVRDALVFVRESWGAQTMTRLWNARVPRPEAEEFYRRIETCTLDQVLTDLEARSMAGPETLRALRPLLADSGRVQKTTISPDPTERMIPGKPLASVCEQRIRENWLGFTTYAHLILAGRHGNIFAKDLHARDTLLLQAHPNRPVYLLKPATVDVGAPPRYYPANRDSIWQAARSVVGGSR